LKDTEYSELLEFIPANGCLIPANSKALDLIAISKNGEKITFKNISPRDEKFHRAYFSFLNFVWCAMPPHFRAKIPCEEFYKFLKMLQGEYDEIFEFKDGRKMIEYRSISFSRMTQQQFKEYIANQIPIIYEDLIMQIYKADQATIVIDSIEEEYKKFLSKII